MTATTWEEMSPGARLMLAIFYEHKVQGGEGLTESQASELCEKALAEFGTIEVAAERVRERALFMKKVAGGNIRPEGQ